MAVKKGNKIKVDYEGKFEDGQVFDSSSHGEHSHPLEFVAGEGNVIKGFDEAVIGLEVNDEKEFTINPEEGYGEYREELKQKFPISSLPKEQEPKEGMILMIGTPDGKQFPAKIVGVDKDSVTIDLNHPLAGKKLIFKIKLVAIEN